jgi:hypothetical protein
MKLLLVTWRDAVTNHSGWCALKDIAKQSPETAKSVGWELKRTKSKLTLVASVSGEEGSQDVTIPIPWIVSEKELVAK